MRGFIEVTIIGFELKDIKREMELKMLLNCRFINNVYDNKIIYRYNDDINVQYTVKDKYEEIKQKIKEAQEKK